jgi:hypothetical protein
VLRAFVKKTQKTPRAALELPARRANANRSHADIAANAIVMAIAGIRSPNLDGTQTLVARR